MIALVLGVLASLASADAAPALGTAEREGVRATVANPAGRVRTFRLTRSRSAVRLLLYVADADGDGTVAGSDARRSAVAGRLLSAADSARPRRRLSRREIVRYARRRAGRDGRFSAAELNRMLRSLGVRRLDRPAPPAAREPLPFPGGPGPGLPSGPGRSSGPESTSDPPPPPADPQPPGPPAASPTPGPGATPTPEPPGWFEPYTVAEAAFGIFHAFDRDDSGIVDADDDNAGQPLLGVMGVQTATAEQVAAFVAAHYDVNGNGMIDCEEDVALYDELFGGLSGDPSC